MSELAALIFDVDGTLAETEEVHRRAFNDAFAAAGLDWSWDQNLYRELLAVTGGKERISHYAARYRPGEVDRMAPMVASLHRDKTARYTALVAAGEVSLRPGVARLLGEARAAGVKLAIATTTSPENVAALLVATLGPASPGWFAAIGAGDVVPRKKPAPDIYQWVLDALGTPASAAVAFEDSLNGLRSAVAARIRTVVTPGLYTDGADFSGALMVVPDLGEPDRSHVTLADLQRWLAAKT
jgi:beta-phosphoglucomutase-like phosphatase (HAD superfamily)